MSNKTTPSGRALEDIAIWGNANNAWRIFDEHEETIRTALKVLDEVQSGRLEKCHPIRDRACGLYSSGSHKVDGYNDCLYHLKQIAGE